MEVALRRLLTATVVLTSLALLISTVIAVLMVGLDPRLGATSRMEPWHMGWLLNNCSNSIADIGAGLHVCLIALPVVAALLVIMQNNFQVAQKWASVHVAASRI